MKGFEPIFDKNSKILILGSFPSVISRENDFYYANKRNRFWKILEEFFLVEFVDRKSRINFLKEKGIALWDIVDSCDIEGSLDSNIKNVDFSDIKSLLEKSQNIKVIFCNGKLSYNLTLKYLNLNGLKIDALYLPSTSPANTCLDKNIWFFNLKKYL